MAFGLDSVIVAAAVLMLILINSSYLDVAKADSANDGVDECAQELVGMATCLPYVGGQSKAPTPDCCSGLKQVLDKNKKCPCVIIQDRNDPDLGLQINVTLALGLPSVCQAPANVSKCPELLHLDPKSPEAEVFYQLEKNSTRTATSLAPTPGTVVEGPASVGSSSSSGAASDHGRQLLRWNETVLVIRGWSWCFTIVFLSMV